MSEGNLPGGLDQVKVIDILTSSRPQRLQDMIKTSRFEASGNLPGCLDEIKVILGDEAAIIHSDLHEGSGFRV